MLIRRNKPAGSIGPAGPLSGADQQQQQQQKYETGNNVAGSLASSSALPPKQIMIGQQPGAAGGKLPPSLPGAIVKLPVGLPSSNLNFSQSGKSSGGGTALGNQFGGPSGLPPPPGLPPGKFISAPPGNLPPGGKFIHPSMMPPGGIVPGKVVPWNGFQQNSLSPQQQFAGNPNQQQQHQHQQQQFNQYYSPPQYESPQRVIPQEFRQASPPPRPARRIPVGAETLNLESQPDDIKHLHKRLSNFFSHYSPYLTREIDHLVIQYADREAELWASLISKYGPEPPFPDEGMDVRSRLIRFFRRYDTAYEGQVDKVLDTYAGHHDLMWKSLTNRFGPEPDIVNKNRNRKELPMDLASRLNRYFTNNDPRRIVKIEELMVTYKGKELELRDMLKSLYDDELEGPFPGGWALLEEQKRKKDREEERRKREEDTANGKILRLEEKLREEEADKDDHKSPSPAGASVSVLDRIEARKKLTNYLRHLSPEREAMAEQILSELTGEEKHAVETIERIFGPVAEIEKKKKEEEEVVRKLKALEEEQKQLQAKRLEQQQQRTLLEQQLESEKKALLERKQAAPVVATPVVDAPAKSSADSGSEQLTRPGPAKVTYPPPPGLTHRQRLVNLFSFYRNSPEEGGPPQLDNVDESMERYKGKEEMMLAILAEKFGPEPWVEEKTGALIPNPHAPPPPPLPPTAAALASPVSDAKNQKDSDRSLVVAANGGGGSGGGNVNAVSATTASATTVVFSPGQGGLSYRDRLLKFYEKYEPSKANDEQMSKVLSKYAGKEGQLFEMLVDKYGPEPASTAVSTAVDVNKNSMSNNNNNNLDPSGNRKRLMEFYQKHEPAKANDVQITKLLQKYEGKEGELFAMLAEKYEEKPQSNNNSNQAPQQQKQPQEPSSSHYERLMRFYTVYEPSKANAEQIERILVKYESREEEQLWPMLTDKYGKEPTDQQVAEAKNRHLTAANSTSQQQPASPTSGPSNNNANNNNNNNNSSSFPSSSSQQLPLDQRLYRFYEYYDPAKATSDQISKVLAKYAGKEDQLFQMLVDKYGPEPSTTAASASNNDSKNNNNPTSSSSAPTIASKPVPSVSTQERVRRFYSCYEPSKATDDHIEKILIKYEGRDEQLIAMLIDKYGAEPTQDQLLQQQKQQQQPQPHPQPASMNNTSVPVVPVVPQKSNGDGASYDRLLRFYQHYEPSKANDEQISKVLKKYDGKEGELFQMLVDKYGPEPSAAASSAAVVVSSAMPPPVAPTNNNNNSNYRDRLLLFYQKYEPSKANDEQMSKVLSKYAGKEGQLFEMLVDKYGPEPGSNAGVINNNNNKSVAASKTPRERLMAFYKKYDPSKATDEQANKVLLKYQGKEDQLFEMLVDKYGPE